MERKQLCVIIFISVFALIILIIASIYSTHFCEEVAASEQDIWVALIPHILFLVVFILIFSFLSWSVVCLLSRKMKYDNEADVATKEFERKMEWEDRYQLTKEERKEKVDHERMIEILNILIKVSNLSKK
jgi:flagellar biosynthesis/type III secretory pathway M-ring protein FliF/YscJ